MKKYFSALIAFVSFLLIGCGPTVEVEPPTVAPVSLKDVPSLRLNYKYEGDVPSPFGKDLVDAVENDAFVLADFTGKRLEDTLIRTIKSPDKQRTIAVYRKGDDIPGSFRIDLYDADGKMLRKISPEQMSVSFPEAIRWSPDSQSFVFLGVLREMNPSLSVFPKEVGGVQPAKKADSLEENDGDPSPSRAASPTPMTDPAILTLRTEQIYLADSTGTEIRPLTQKEGLIYYHMEWSPDGTALVAMAASFQEWRFIQQRADINKEAFVPQGRPRIIEKNGRERILDDNLSASLPVWSPDSAKIAMAYDRRIHLYDFIGDNPTQGAVPLRNELLISSEAFDRAERAGQEAASTTVEKSSQVTTLPDEKTLISYQPIVVLAWTATDTIYFKTGLVKDLVNGERVRGSERWHRLILTPQATVMAQ
jgi:dipeptidyl aminopeptidase/acylaminoacyl peptidase